MTSLHAEAGGMTVVVAGGSRGIGLELAVGVSDPGEPVVIGYAADQPSADRACERLSSAGRAPTAIQADLSTLEGATALMAAATEVGGPLRVLVHSSVTVVPGGLLELSDDDLARTLAVNATSLLWLARAARPQMARGSSVLYLTSRGGRQVVSGYGAVGPAKSYGEGLVRYLAVELAGEGIRINALAPGTQDTQALRDVFGQRTDEVIAAARSKNPSGRLVEPADYVSMARFLASPDAAMVTGQCMFVYGGADLLG